MPPERHRRPGTAVTVNRSAEAFIVDYTTTVEATATAGDFAYLWVECPAHEWLGVSVLGSWCVGDGAELTGHWVAP